MKSSLKKSISIIGASLVAIAAIVLCCVFKGANNRGDGEKLKMEHESFLENYFADLGGRCHASADPVTHGGIFIQAKQGVYVYQGKVRPIDDLMGKYKFCRYFGCIQAPSTVAIVPRCDMFDAEIFDLSNILNCEKNWYKLVPYFVDGYFYYAVMEFSPLGELDDIRGWEYLLESGTGFKRCYFVKSKLSYDRAVGEKAAFAK